MSAAAPTEPLPLATAPPDVPFRRSDLPIGCDVRCARLARVCESPTDGLAACGSCGGLCSACESDGTLSRVRQLPYVAGVSDPLAPGAISRDQTIARAEVRYDRSTTDLGREAYTRLRDAVGPARRAGLQVEIGGPLASWEQTMGSTEWIGVLVAIVVLTVVFGSVLAMLLPLGLALSAILIGQALVTVLAGFVDVPSSTPQLVLMIGLGVAGLRAVRGQPLSRSGPHRRGP